MILRVTHLLVIMRYVRYRQEIEDISQHLNGAVTHLDAGSINVVVSR